MLEERRAIRRDIHRPFFEDRSGRSRQATGTEGSRALLIEYPLISPVGDRRFQLTLRHFFRGLAALLILVVPAAALGSSSYLFVFDRSGTIAKVFDAETWRPAGTPVVGRGAFAAFGIPNRAGAGFEKFYVVANGSVVILDSDFAPQGTVFLREADSDFFGTAITRDAALCQDPIEMSPLLAQ